MRLREMLLELLYPRRCPFCRKLMNPGREICPLCEDELPKTRGEGIRQHFPFVDECYSPLYYEKAVRESLLRYKFGGAAAYAEIYAVLMAKCIDEKQFSCDIITWVPLSRRRLRIRGYDQARLLAESLAKRMAVESRCLLIKTRHTPAQSGMGGTEDRRNNAAGAYTVADAELFKNKRILLVDDIVTTGSTLSECARMLRKAGVKSVSAVTVARRRP